MDEGYNQQWINFDMHLNDVSAHTCNINNIYKYIYIYAYYVTY